LLKKTVAVLAPLVAIVALSMVPMPAAAKTIFKCPAGVTNHRYCTKVCPKAMGRLRGTRLGLTNLGESRAALRKAYINAGSRLVRHHKFRDVFCLNPKGVRVGYGSPALLRSHSTKLRKRYRGRAVEATTSNSHYALKGIRFRSSLRAAEKKFPGGNLIHVGLNLWYVVHRSPATAVFKTRHGKVGEVGIAVAALTVTRSEQKKFIRSFH
jgi:hypothetical protein